MRLIWGVDGLPFEVRYDYADFLPLLLYLWFRMGGSTLAHSGCLSKSCISPLKTMINLILPGAKIFAYGEVFIFRLYLLRLFFLFPFFECFESMCVIFLQLYIRNFRLHIIHVHICLQRYNEFCHFGKQISPPDIPRWQKSILSTFCKSSLPNGIFDFPCSFKRRRYFRRSSISLYVSLICYIFIWAYFMRYVIDFIAY